MLTDSVLCYIKTCIDNVTVDKTIMIYPNHKPWMTKEVQLLVKRRNITFRSGDKALYSVATANLKRGIGKAKSDYRRRTEDHLNGKNSEQVWQGLEHITNHKTNLGVAGGDITHQAHISQQPTVASSSHWRIGR